MTSPNENEESRVAASLDALGIRFIETNVNLISLVRAVQSQANQTSARVKSIRRQTLFTIFLAGLLAVALGYQIFNAVGSRNERRDQYEQSKIRQEQLLNSFDRQGQALSTAQKIQDSNNATITWCAKGSENVLEYRSCLKPYGIQLPK
jgi:hypothetical protein